MRSRYMAVCKAKNCVLQPEFPENAPKESQHITKANVRTAIFRPLDNCPHVEQLRKEGKLPWATASIDFLKTR